MDDCPSLVVLMDGADQETRDAITAALEPIAKEYQEKAKASGVWPAVWLLVVPCWLLPARKRGEVGGERGAVIDTSRETVCFFMTFPLGT